MTRVNITSKKELNHRIAGSIISVKRILEAYKESEWILEGVDKKKAQEYKEITDSLIDKLKGLLTNCNFEDVCNLFCDSMQLERMHEIFEDALTNENYHTENMVLEYEPHFIWSNVNQIKNDFMIESY